MNKVEDIARSVLDANDVVDVVVSHDVNADGEPVLWIEIVYRGEEPPSVDRMAALTEQIWRSERQAGSLAFPVISYVSEMDQDEVVAAE